MDCSLPGSYIHGIFQARVLEWVVIAFSNLTKLKCFFHNEGNYKEGEKTASRMGENNSKQSNWQRINLKNIQAAHAAQFQKNKWPNQKMELWKILKEMGIPDHLTCHLRNLYAGEEAKVRTGHGTTDWFQIRKGVHQSCVLSPCINLNEEYIMWNARLDEIQAGIKIAGTNSNNLRYADDTTLTAESKEELKSPWWKWKRRVKKLA